MYTLDALGKLESESRVIAKRDMASEASRLLRQHQAGLVKAWPRSAGGQVGPGGLAGFW